MHLAQTKSRIAKPSYKNSRMHSPEDWMRWLDSQAFEEDGIEITNRDLLNEELCDLSPLALDYLRWLEQKAGIR
jgi:hypothetical protein